MEGGLVSRYVVGLLYAKGVFESVTPINFTTFASPHLGIRHVNSGFFHNIANYLGPRLLSASGRQMFIADHNPKPLLVRMTEKGNLQVKINWARLHFHSRAISIQKPCGIREYHKRSICTVSYGCHISIRSLPRYDENKSVIPPRICTNNTSSNSPYHTFIQTQGSCSRKQGTTTSIPHRHCAHPSLVGDILPSRKFMAEFLLCSTNPTTSSLPKQHPRRKHGRGNNP